MVILGIAFCIALLALPCLTTFALTAGLRGWARVLVLLAVFALPLWLGYNAHDCDIHDDATDNPCMAPDWFAFLGLVGSVGAAIGIIAGTIRNLFRRSRAPESEAQSR